MTGAPEDHGTDQAEVETPSPALEPDQVVARVVEALANNDRPAPDHGIRVLHAFASDRMRSAIGDADAFRRALHNAAYAPLVNAQAVAADALERRGDSARGSLTVASRQGRVRFTIALVRARHGARRGCWLVSGIAREGVDL